MTHAELVRRAAKWLEKEHAVVVTEMASGALIEPDALGFKGGHWTTMTVDEICALPVSDHADVGCHLWLWTTNSFIEAGFRVMRAWGFKYLAPIHWIKPSGLGNWVVHRTQTVLLGYRERCIFDKRRYFPNIIQAATPARHSQKPEESYSLIESVSHEPRLEMFARTRRHGWLAWGNEVHSDVEIS